MKIKYDQFTQKYFIYHTESNVVAMSFQELEEFSQQLHQIVTDEYSRVLQMELDLNANKCESGACEI